MTTHRHIDIICIIITVLALVTTAVFMKGESLGITRITDEDAEGKGPEDGFTAKDMDGDWDTSGATVITLNGDNADISGQGAYVLDGSVYITGAGDYVVSGELNDGSIYVDAYDSSKIRIMLNGASVSCSDNAALYIKQADKVFLTLAEGSSNSLTSGSEYSEEALADGADGCIYTHDDLTINGSGTLTVTAGYKHGIEANDALAITGGQLTVTAVEDGLHVNDEIKIADGDITIHASDDGIHSDTSFLMTDGSLYIDECYEGIEALTVDIQGGDIELYTTDDGINANGGSNDFVSAGRGGAGAAGDMRQDGKMADRRDSGLTGATDDAAESSADDSADGMRGRMRGGKMQDGEVPDMADRPTPPDGEMPDGEAPDMADRPTPPDGEMPDGEAPDMTDRPTPPDGEMPEVDGTNNEQSGVTNGTEGTTKQSADDTFSEDSECWIRISGGSIYIQNDTARDADGLDSNGDVIITGGDIRISLPGDGSNCAIDYGSESGGVCEISGGTVIACGSAAMAESGSSSSTQCGILYIPDSTVASGTDVILKDSEGNILLEWEVPNSSSAISLSHPDLKIGETYTIVTGDDEKQITIEETATSVGSGGGFGSGGFKGTMPDGLDADDLNPSDYKGGSLEGSEESEDKGLR